MAGKITTNSVVLGDSITDTQNFVLKTNADGTATLARGALGGLGTVFGVNGSGALTGATLVSPTITGTGSILASSIGGNITQSNIVTTTVSGSTVSGTWTDSGASLSLVAGTYLITATAVIYMDAQSGNNVQAFRICKLSVTDSSNSAKQSAYSGVSSGYGFYPITVSFFLTVSSTTTYKTRFANESNAGSPTVGTMNLYCNAADVVTHSIIATRLT